jgi:hypothetical protein
VLVVGAGQIRALEAARLNSFVHQLAKHLRLSFGDALKKESDEELLATARFCCDAAKPFGIELQDDVRRYAEFVVKYGHRMHEDQRHPWIGRVLTAHGLSGTDKMNTLDNLELQIAASIA